MCASTPIVFVSTRMGTSRWVTTETSGGELRTPTAPKTKLSKADGADSTDWHHIKSSLWGPSLHSQVHRQLRLPPSDSVLISAEDISNLTCVKWNSIHYPSTPQNIKKPCLGISKPTTNSPVAQAPNLGSSSSCSYSLSNPPTWPMGCTSNTYHKPADYSPSLLPSQPPPPTLRCLPSPLPSPGVPLGDWNLSPRALDPFGSKCPSRSLRQLPPPGGGGAV